MLITNNGLNIFFRQAQQLLKRTVNLIILLSMILTSCRPVNQGTDSQVPIEPTITPSEITKISQEQEQEYIPPVFIQPEPRIAKIENVESDNVDLSIPTIPIIPEQPEIPEEFKTQIEAAFETFDEAMRQLDSLNPPPNPIRTINMPHQPKTENKPVAVRSPNINVSNNVYNLRFQFQNEESTIGEKLVANPRQNDWGTTFIVSTLADTDDGTCDNDCSLREAIYAANELPGADSIEFNISGTIFLDATLPYIDDPDGLTIDGTGQTILIDGNESEQIFYISTGASLSLTEISMTNGYIYNAGELIITNINYENEGFYSESQGTISISDSTFTDSPITTKGSLSLLNCHLVRSSVYTYGTLDIVDSSSNNGYIQSVGTLTLTNILFSDGYVYSGDTLDIADGSFSSSSSTGNWLYSEGNFTITDSSLNYQDGGSLYSELEMNFSNNSFDCSGFSCYMQSAGDFNLTDSSFTTYERGSVVCLEDLFIDNTPLEFTGDGNIYAKGMLTMTDSSFSATDYSYIYSEGVMAITNTPVTNMIDSASVSSSSSITYSGGTITSSSGGTLFSHDILTIVDSVIRFGSTGSTQGVNRLDIINSDLTNGSVYGIETSSYTNSSFSNNTMINASPLTIIGNTSFNTVSFSGAMASEVTLENNSTLSISNSSLSDCVNIINNGSLISKNNTFSNCPIVNSAELNLFNTIMANGSTCTGTVSAGNNNLLETSGIKACNLRNRINGNIIGPRANLAEAYGTPSYFPLTGSSPAIGQGDTAICSAAPVNNTSQNGVTRLLNSTCDIGAYEAKPIHAIDDRTTVSSSSKDGSISSACCAQYETEKPINTHTGGFQYSVEDISIQTTAGQLSITRDYASLGISLPTTLSPGWTHNQDTRLIMPDDPGGEMGAILFKLHSSNQYSFYAQPDGTYQPATGILASLDKQTGLPITYVITDSSQNTYTFDENGSLLTYSDPVGNQWEYTYTTSSLLETISANEGTSSLSFAYDAESRVTSIIDQTGREVIYGYDANGDLSSVTDILDQTWTYTYDSAHRLTAALDPNGITLERNEYDEQGRVARQYDGNGNLTVALIYNADGTTTVTDALGNSSIHTYDERGTLINEADPGGNASETTYLADFRPFRLTDEQNRITDLSWSADGANLTRLVDNEGNQINITYDEFNNPLSVVRFA